MENGSAEEVDIPKGVRVVNSVIIVISMVVGISGNTLVLIAYCLSRRLRTKTNIFVINLATADIFTCFCLPVFCTSLLIEIDLSSNTWLDVLCGIDYTLLQIFVCCSFLTLALIAANRYILVTKSQETYKWVYQKKFIAISICFSWLYPSLYVTFLPLFDIGHIGYDEKLHACGARTAHPNSYVYDMIIVCNGIIPISLIFYSYGGIYFYMRRHNKQMKHRRSTSLRNLQEADKLNESNVSEHQVDITKNLFYILLSFLFCISPYMLSEILNASSLIISYTKLIVTFNSCVNPIIYGVKHPHFRQIFRKILLRRWNEIPEPAFGWMKSGTKISSRVDLKSNASQGVDLESNESQGVVEGVSDEAL